MDERRFSEHLRRALDGEPRPGSFERLQAALDRREAGPRRRPAAWAPAVAIVLAVAIVATLVVARRPHAATSAPAAQPPPVATRGTLSVYFVETPQAWWLLESDTMANSTLYRSTDAGRHWTATYTTREEIWLPYPNGTGLAEPHLLLATQDGPLTVGDGVHVTAAPHPQGWTALTPTYLANGRDGWTVGSRDPKAAVDLLRTADGGATWTASPLPVENGAFARSPVVLFDTHTGFLAPAAPVSLTGGTLVPGAPHAWVTRDGGRTWTVSQIPAGYQGADMSLAGRSGVLVAKTGSGRLHVARSTDGGIHWSDTGKTAPGDSVDLLSTTAWITWSRGGTISVTADGGRSYTTREVPLPALPTPSPTARPLGGGTGIASVQAADARHWLVDVSSTSGVGPGRHALLATSDGGATWAQVPIPG